MKKSTTIPTAKIELDLMVQHLAKINEFVVTDMKNKSIKLLLIDIVPKLIKKAFEHEYTGKNQSIKITLKVWQWWALYDFFTYHVSDKGIILDTYIAKIEQHIL